VSWRAYRNRTDDLFITRVKQARDDLRLHAAELRSTVRCCPSAFRANRLVCHATIWPRLRAARWVRHHRAAVRQSVPGSLSTAPKDLAQAERSNVVDFFPFNC